jgi:hypothetical protein
MIVSPALYSSPEPPLAISEVDVINMSMATNFVSIEKVRVFPLIVGIR